MNNITPSQFHNCLSKLNCFCHCNCKCFMHSQCLHDWIITKQVCPICRQKINIFPSFDINMDPKQIVFYQKVKTIRNNLQLRLRERFRLASAHSHKIMFVLQTIMITIVNLSIIYIIINSFFFIAFALLS